MTIYANGAMHALEGSSMSYAEKLEEISRDVRHRAFKDRFNNPKRSAPSGVDSTPGHTHVPLSRKQRLYEKLPEDAKAQCDKDVAQGLLTKEQYLRDYESED